MDTKTKDLLPIITKSELSPIEKARATALARNYAWCWTGFKGEIVGVELPLEVELKETNGWLLSGTIDTLTRRDGEYIMIEHKTKAGEVDKIHDGYYRKLKHDMQITMYHILLECNGMPVEQTIYDVIRKLGTSAKRIPAGKLDDENPKAGTQAEMCKLGTYHGMELDGKDLAWLAAYMEKKTLGEVDPGPLKESPKLYEFRMSVAIAEDPEKYFKQYGQIRRTHEQMGSAITALRSVCNRIDDTPHEEEQWCQNTSQCNSYGTACEYMDVCAGFQDIDGDQYNDRKGSATSAEKSLSHSKLTCYLSCQRKYYYRYVCKREHAKEKAPALQFGSVFHEFLAGFWESR